MYLNKAEMRQNINFLYNQGVRSIRIMGSTQGSFHCHNVQEVTEDNGELNTVYYDRLDYFLSILDEYNTNARTMKVVIVLSNFWYWTGGLSWYLNQSINCTKMYKEIPCPDNKEFIEEAFIKYTEGFYKCEDGRNVLKKFISNLLNRVNKYKNNTRYMDDTVIMAWEIINDPKADKMKAELHDWVQSISNFIKEIDPNHLVTVGVSGRGNVSDYQELHEIDRIDYMTFSLMPKEWDWDIKDIDALMEKTTFFVDSVLNASRIVRKPLVMNLFRYPRDNEHCDRTANTTNRNTYYKHVLELFTRYAEDQLIVASYFWGWSFNSYSKSGGCRVWERGDPVIGDSTDMFQGYYSVYEADKETLKVIEDAAAIINNLQKITKVPNYVWIMFIGIASVLILAIIIFIFVSCRDQKKKDEKFNIENVTSSTDNLKE
eukprot:TRINITY_DN11526_c0_g1_i3.p1 TRINITY_DN11526_c0_g1~~TRINITY_DN11526_c0_g1_i3.p1  ORF type:complete len:430 (+),score=85.96 TRINITY_DN11526_c0_g1_i3:240-1529(+)